jgi:hypothetical protein
MKKESISIFAGLLLLLISVAAFASAPQPEYMPYCQSPQQISPMTLVGDKQPVSGPFIAWNGKDYGVIYGDYYSSGVYRLFFRRFFSDGTPASALVQLSSLGTSCNVDDFVFNGNGYGISYTSRASGNYQAFFAGIDLNGNVVYGPTKVSFVGMTEAASTGKSCIAFSGSGYCVAWDDDRVGNYDIFATLLNLDGTIAGSGAFHDIPVCSNTATAYDTDCAWMPGSNAYRIVWRDYRSGAAQIYGATFDTGAGVSMEWPMVSHTGSNPFSPCIIWAPGGASMTWNDERNGNVDVYFARYDKDFWEIGTDVAVTTSSYDNYNHNIVWTGAEYGVFFQGYSSGNDDTWFQRISSSGALIGSNTQVTFTNGMYSKSAAFGKYGYMIAGISAYLPYVEPLGCNYENSAPSCPLNLIAYNISGTQATISWGLSGDNETDMAYYIVYRNNSEIAKTSSNYYTDTGLSTNTTYNYMVQPVNAAQIQNYACGTSIYTKTNATLTLLVNKNDPNAHLSWSESGLNNYNVFRGTSPQVMSLIGSTSGQSADDANVLLDKVNYFYTVDDPGQ